MACADQYQYCNGDDGDNDNTKCTPLTGYDQAWASLNSSAMGLNDAQYTVASRIALSSRALSTFHSIGGRGAQALRAQDTIYDRVQQIPLPDDQWKVELQSWFAVSMARLQHAMVEYAAPSTSKEAMPVGAYLQEPLDAASHAMCNSQKVSLEGETVSFSVLGVAVILAVGTAVVLIYLLLQPLVGWIQRRMKLGEYRRVRWVMDDKMQVQRMAFEEAGMGGTWTNLDGSVPVTQGRDVFGDLSDVDFNAPRLGKQWIAAKKDVAGSEDNVVLSPLLHQPLIDTKSPAQMQMHYAKPNRPYQVYQAPVYQALTPQEDSREPSMEDRPPHAR